MNLLNLHQNLDLQLKILEHGLNIITYSIRLWWYTSYLKIFYFKVKYASRVVMKLRFNFKCSEASWSSLQYNEIFS
jgi:hypothetical protein